MAASPVPAPTQPVTASMPVRPTADDGALGLALLLAGLAGWVDAAGVTGSSGLFLSFMSGNTTDLAAAFIQQDWWKVMVIGVVIATFILGVIAGELLEPLGGRLGQSWVLAAEGVMLASGAMLHWNGLTLPHGVAIFRVCPLVLAMGLQNATVHRAGGISISLTYVTGTLVQIGRAVAGAMRGNGGIGRAVPYAALWTSLAIGAALGTVALSWSPFGALAAASAGALLLAALVGLSPSPARR